MPMGFLVKCLKAASVFLAFCAALALGLLKGLFVGPVASLVIMVGNIGVLLGLFPAHVCWSVYTLFVTDRVNIALKLVILVALPIFFGLWLAIGIVGSVLVGLGYGFFAPLVSTFEAFRQCGTRDKCYHCIVDGTWDIIRGSCTVVRDCADVCYHSFPVYLKELREKSPEEHQTRTIRLRDIPACIAVAVAGFALEPPLLLVIALIKSPYMLFKGWQRLLQDLIRGEGPFLETACIPIAGLAIIFWPLIVIGSVAAALISGFFLGLYGSIVVYQERSFRRGLAYLVAVVSEFDEYTNDILHLSEGSFFPRPQYRRKKVPNSSELSVRPSTVRDRETSMTPPALLVPRLAPSKSVREVIQEVKAVQIWNEITRSCDLEGKGLIDEGLITSNDLSDWLIVKESSQGSIVGRGLPSYSLLRKLLDSIRAGTQGILLSSGAELNYLNRPNDRLLEWFFHPVMVIKEQIKAHNLNADETRYLEMITLFAGNPSRMESVLNGIIVAKDSLRAAQIQAISRRLIGIMGSISKLPTHRRKFENAVKILNEYALAKAGVPTKSHSMRSAKALEIV